MSDCIVLMTNGIVMRDLKSILALELLAYLAIMPKRVYANMNCPLYVIVMWMLLLATETPFIAQMCTYVPGICT